MPGWCDLDRMHVPVIRGRISLGHLRGIPAFLLRLCFDPFPGAFPINLGCILWTIPLWMTNPEDDPLDLPRHVELVAVYLCPRVRPSCWATHLENH